jgi:hypothetical protein
MDAALFEHAVANLTGAQANPIAACKICRAESLPFDLLDFNKSCEGFPHQATLTPVLYRRCCDCGFIFTDFFDSFTSEMWRKHVYNDDYDSIDPEYKTVRPRMNAHLIRTFLVGRKHSTIGLDYGGGNGKTSALMRERGWVFDSFDPFGQTTMDPAHVGKYDFSSAIEVFEHTTDPVETLRDIVSKMSPDRMMILISTSLTDGAISEKSGLAWSYAAPRNGHVSLYSRRALEKLASGFGLQCVCLGSGPYFVFRGYRREEIKRLVIQGKLLRRLHFLNRRFYRNLTSKEIA